MSIFSNDKTSAESSHINVIAEFQTKPEHAEAVTALLTGLVAPSRAEDGCEQYHLLVDKQDPTRLYTYEEWTGEDKLQTHLDGAKSILGTIKGLLASEMKLTILNHLV